MINLLPGRYYEDETLISSGNDLTVDSERVMENISHFINNGIGSNGWACLIHYKSKSECNEERYMAKLF